MDKFKKIQSSIVNLWNSNFTDDKNLQKLIEEDNKTKIIIFFIKRLQFCDIITPKNAIANTLDELINTEFTEEDNIKLFCIQLIRVDIIKDIQKNKYKTEIEEYYKNLCLNGKITLY